MLWENMIRRELSDYVAAHLEGLFLNGNFQIHPSFGLDSFFEAFKNNSFNINFDDSGRKAKFSLKNSLKNCKVNSVRASYDTIYKGLKNGLESSYSAYFSSMDFISKILDDSASLVDKKGYFQNRKSLLKGSFNNNLLGWFREYHEKILADSKGEFEPLEGEGIFEEVYRSIPGDIYKSLAVIESYGKVPFQIVEPDELLEKGVWYELDEDEFFPSKYFFYDYFSGLYLNGLSNSKRYETFSKGEEKLSALVNEGIHAFKGVF